MELCENVVRIQQELGEDLNASLTRENIGGLYAYAKMFDEALRYMNDTLKFHLSDGDGTHAANNMVDIGSVYRETGEFDKALERESISAESNKLVAGFDLRLKMLALE